MPHFFNINYPTYKGKNMTVRTEHDLLGDREIPAEVYWGIHTLRAIENFK
ncbi:aspartate ammonia-lyase, partial [Kingella kingae]|nr:aspartate ammonia-lyase [Kingella kingae]